MMKRIIKYILLLFTVVMFSCETTRLELTENPNVLGLSSADPNFVLNTLQLSFNGQQRGLSATSFGPTRMRNEFGSYNANTTQMNGTWNNSYAYFNNFNALEAIAVENNLTVHLGMAQVMKAFMYVNLVDYIGTAVFTEAINVDFPNPGFDAGADIYAAMHTLLDDAIVNLNTTPSSSPTIDMFYGGDVSKWVKVANTLKLKMYLQTRLVTQAASTAGINAIIAGGNYITSSADDFQFQYGTSQVPVNNRHPDFRGNYESGVGGYMSNGFMDHLMNSKAAEDPRLRYYIYRQTIADPSGDKLPCAGSLTHNFCYVGNGYWGRDHQDDEGIPNDGDEKPTWGAYPAGGAFDNDAFLVARNNTGLGGAGINPILLSTYVQFMLAEAALTLGTTGSAATYLENGMQASFDKVTGFVAGTATGADVAAYIAEANANYAAAANDSERLDVIMTEYYVALWGNGLEAYNNLRRTLFPSFLEQPIQAGGAFPRQYFIPDSEIVTNFNPDLVQHGDVGERVFWDTNPAGAIN